MQGSFQAYAQEAGFFGEVFHVPEAFDPDYEEMERKFKIFVYPHNTSSCRTLNDEYGNEGLFYLNLNRSRFLTKDPEKAHLFLIPISCHSLPAGVYSLLILIWQLNSKWVLANGVHAKS